MHAPPGAAIPRLSTSAAVILRLPDQAVLVVQIVFTECCTTVPVGDQQSSHSAVTLIAPVLTRAVTRQPGVEDCVNSASVTFAERA